MTEIKLYAININGQSHEISKEVYNRLEVLEDQASDLAVNVVYDLLTALLLRTGFAHVKNKVIKELFKTVLEKHKIYDKFINKVTKEFENSNGNNGS